jgi:hypothetical protein
MCDSRTEHHIATFTHSGDADLQAYNDTFIELGLSWYWDGATYEDLLRIAGERNRIGAYLESHQAHLLKAYEKDFLCELIYSTKVRRREAMVERKPASGNSIGAGVAALAP